MNKERGKMENKTIKDLLNNYGIEDIEQNDLFDDFLEMSQIKSDFDIEKFTIKKEGNFIAHNYHFLMRQYSIAVGEATRIGIERERLLLDLEEKNKEVANDEIQIKRKELDIREIKNNLRKNKLTLANQVIKCHKFEQARKKLIEMNGGKKPTNEDYQKEEPQYWKWFLLRKAKWQSQARISGVSEGVFENIDMLEEPSLINPNFQIKVTDDNGLLPLYDFEKLELERKGFKENLKKLENLKLKEKKE